MEERECAVEIAAGLAEPCHRDAAPVLVLRKAGGFAEIDAGLEVVRCRVDLVAFEQYLAQTDVHIGSTSESGRAGGEAQSAGECLDRVSEPALRDLNVGEPERATEDVGDVASGPEALDGFRVAVARRIQVAM